MSSTLDGGDHAMLNHLQVVDDAFGAHADLYQDCLRISTNATFREIQNAFLEKRRELIRKLEEGQDCHKQMDAVVLAVRILGDADPRAQYDDIRVERMRRACSPEPDHIQDVNAMTSSDNKGGNPDSVHDHHEMQFTDVDLVNTSFESSEMHNSPVYGSYIQRAPKRQARIVTPEPRVDDATVYTYDETVDQTLDDMTIMSGDTHLIPQNQTLLDRIANECIGAFEDTSKSLEEVFSVFTLQEEEIDAVVKRINKAKRQMNWAVV